MDRAKQPKANITGVPGALYIPSILAIAPSRRRKLPGVAAPGHFLPLSGYITVRDRGYKNVDGQRDHRKAEPSIDFHEEGYKRVFNILEPVRIEFLYKR